MKVEKDGFPAAVAQAINDVMNRHPEDVSNQSPVDQPEPGDNEPEQAKISRNYDGQRRDDNSDSSSESDDVDKVSPVGNGEQSGITEVREDTDGTDTDGTDDGDAAGQDADKATGHSHSLRPRVKQREVMAKPTGHSHSHSQRSKGKQREAIAKPGTKKARFHVNDEEVMSARPSRPPPPSRPLHRTNSGMSRARGEKREPDLPLKVALPLEEPMGETIPAMAGLVPQPAEVKGVVLTLFPANTHREPIEHEYRASAEVVRNRPFQLWK